MKKIYLVDVSSMFFRAYYAIRPLTSPSGIPVNAVYGFLSMITKLLKDEKPEYMVFCYDRKDPSFRKEMYDGYKANRTEMPDELAQQIPYIKKLADLLGIPSLEVPQYEADDLIGTLTKFARRQNMEAVIVSGDKDFAQLIEEHVVLFDTMKEVKYDSAKTFEKWGVRPDQFIDYLAIVGDTSDNVPGVKGVGEKGAIKLLEQFKTLEDIYENIDKVESKSVRQKLIDSKEMALLSKKLVTIVVDVPVSQEVANYKLQGFRTDELRALLKELNFNTFEKKLISDLGDSAAATGIAQTASASLSATSSVSPATDVSKASSTAAESVTVNTFEFKNELLQIEISAEQLSGLLKPQENIWVHEHQEKLYLWKPDATEFYFVNSELKELGPYFDQKNIQWNGFDLKLLWHKTNASNPTAAWDTQLAAYALKAGDSSDFEKIFFREAGAELPEDASPAHLVQAHMQLASILKHKLTEQCAEQVYKNFDLPLAHILFEMEKRGIMIDRELLSEQSQSLGHDVAILEKDIQALAGEEFNVASPKQLGVILFEKLGLEATKKTKTGYSTDVDVLEKIEHPIAAKILQFRELSKLKSTYVDALPELADTNGRVHTSFNQALTATGRLSSTHPNLQNIPIRTERGQQVRKAFIASAGKKLMSVDYSQIELRILAHISEDPNLCKAFAEDLDIHSATAAEIFHIDLKQVNSDHRRVAKAVNFGIAYGQEVFGLAETLGIPRGEAQDIIKRYFERFKNVKDYIENTVKIAHEKGYVETLFGRRRYIDELNAKNAMLRKFGERAAINAPIQGTASDLVKKAMIDLSVQVPSVPMLLQVHDELIFEETEDVLIKHQNEIVSIMEKVAQLKVPLKVNFAIGNNWDEAH